MRLGSLPVLSRVTPNAQRRRRRSRSAVLRSRSSNCRTASYYRSVPTGGGGGATMAGCLQYVSCSSQHPAPTFAVQNVTHPCGVTRAVGGAAPLSKRAVSIYIAMHLAPRTMVLPYQLPPPKRPGTGIATRRHASHRFRARAHTQSRFRSRPPGWAWSQGHCSAVKGPRCILGVGDGPEA